MSHDLIKTWRARLPDIESLKDKISSGIRDALENVPHIDRISSRLKTEASFLRKATRVKGYRDPFKDIEDQIGCRVIVFFKSDIQVVEDSILRFFRKVERKYMKPESVSEFAYESHHLNLIIPPQMRPDNAFHIELLPEVFEVQIRTILMHAYAEPQHDLVYKADGDIPLSIKRRLAWIAASCWGADREYDEIRSMLE